MPTPKFLSRWKNFLFRTKRRGVLTVFTGLFLGLLHGSDNNALLRKPATTLCLDCHSPQSPNGPRALTIEQHTHHKPGSPGNE
ncbi:MAG: cytochrome family protein [Phycisphaerales bacterium]|nr:cytochrome family protein [Phycisphaerales bacterium]